MKLMKLAGVALAASLAFAPVAAKAAVVNITDDITDAVATNVSITNQSDIFIYDASLQNVVSGQQAIFTFSNDTGSNLTLGAGLPATVNPTGSFPAGTMSWSGGTTVALEGGQTNTVLTAGSTGTLTVFFGDQVGSLANVDENIK